MLAVSLVALVALFDWTFVHVIGQAAPSATRVGTAGPTSGVHGTVTGTDAHTVPGLENGASRAVSSVSAGAAIPRPVPVSPASAAVAKASDATAAEAGGATVETAEDAPAAVVDDAPAEAIDDAAARVIEGATAEAVAGTDAADVSVSAATPAGESADAAREAAGTPFPETAAALPDTVDASRSSDVVEQTSGANAADIGIDADTDTEADLEALRRLLAEVTAVEASTQPFEEGRGPLAEPTASDGDASPLAPATTLADLAEAMRFEPRSATFERGATRALDELAALLAARSDLTVTIGVAVEEFRDEARVRLLGRERGRAIIAALVARGVAFERLSLSTDDNDTPRPGSHRVRILADTDE